MDKKQDGRARAMAEHHLTNVAKSHRTLELKINLKISQSNSFILNL